MNLSLILLCICGLMLHFVTRWGDAWRTSGRISPLAFALLDPPAWIAAVLGAIACMMMLRALVSLLGVSETFSVDIVLQILAFTSGYMGSSIATKVPKFFISKTPLADQERQP